MRVSVVVCTYSPELYEHCQEAVESVLSGSYDDVEIVLVVDGDETVGERARADYGDREDVVVHVNEENRGLSASRNEGIERASGEVVAFLDDDAVADEEWVATLVEAYEETDAIAAGGTQTPLWVAGEPAFLPEEFYWLIGATYPGFAEPGEELRNTFGSNMSYRREVLEELGGFATEVGRKGDKHLQGEEPELGARMQRRYGKGVRWVPEAEIYHKIFDYRTDPVWLGKRAFWQGYSKRAMSVLLPDTGDEESDYLSRLAFDSLPRLVGQAVRSPSRETVSTLLALVLLTGLVGAGYVYGALSYRGG